ncbi:MAG: hypothetical protein IJ760_01895 [Bacteroidales bacterium]|nr:hypothetical protein [Bacteroidales bacterium]
MKRLVTLAALAAVLAVMMAACEPEDPKPVDTTRGEEPVPQAEPGYDELILGTWQMVAFNGTPEKDPFYEEYLPGGIYFKRATPQRTPDQDTMNYRISNDSVYCSGPGYRFDHRILELNDSVMIREFTFAATRKHYRTDFVRVSE